MDLNGAGLLRRTTGDEKADVKQKYDNWLSESWRKWQNEAQFEGLEEHRGPVEFAVQGTIPAWAAGSLFRIGPGETSVKGTPRGTHHITHWFDGTAHTHRFDIIPSDGPNKDSNSARVIYSSRRQGDDVVASIRKQGWLSSTSFGQRSDPCVGVFAKVMSVFEPARSNNNVALIPNMPGMPTVEKTPDSPRTDAATGGHRAGVATNLIAVTDSSFLQKLDPNTLEPIGAVNQSYLHPELRGQVSCAHARFDPENGDLYNFNLEFGGVHPIYRIFRVNAASGKADILETLAGPKYRPAYIHSFFLTKNYVVLCLPAAHFGWVGLKVVWEKNFIDAIKPFDETQPCRWIVVDRRHGKGLVAEFTTPAMFFFHSVNGFEEDVDEASGDDTERDTTGHSSSGGDAHVNGGGGDRDGDGSDGNDDSSGTSCRSHGTSVDLCLDLVQYDNTDIMHTMYYDILLDRNDAVKSAMIDKKWYKTTQSSLVRYKFQFDPSHPQTLHDIKTATAKSVFCIPSPHSGDLPMINPNYAGRPHRYVWSVCNRGLSTFMDSLVKTDLHTQEALIWSGPASHSPGEPIFVARPRGGTGQDGDGDGERDEDEDDGVILSLVLDGVKGLSYLLCLDARTMKEVGRAEAEFAIAIGLHGSFLGRESSRA